jgi:DNA-binding response OmpR family regulator
MKPILIVEDETILRESLRDWLTDSGYDVIATEAGEEALKDIAEQDFDVAILDLRLPGKNGIEILREAKARSPHIKGIIITAYPSVQTAVEAMKEGAVEYLPKPIDLNNLETLLRQTLGPVQVEIKTAETKAKVAREVKVEKPLIINPEEVPVHLKQGKAHFEAQRYQEAMKEFQAVLQVAPGSIETRVWIRKVAEALAKPEAAAAGVAIEAKAKECLWMRMGMVAHRICTNDYNCITCEFDQMMQEKMAAGDTPELEAALQRLKELPGTQRLCRYAIKGEVSYRICSRVFHCATCEFGQMMEDGLEQKLAKLATRREALLKKEAKTKAS